jgi:hypothetical protein
MENLIVLIVSIAIEVGVPQHLMVALALTENPRLDTLAINNNKDGTKDLGLMQLNNSWFKGDWKDPATNVRAAAIHVKTLRDYYKLSWYDVAVAYNCGIKRVLDGAVPVVSYDYGADVMWRWKERDPYFYLYAGE